MQCFYRKAPREGGSEVGPDEDAGACGPKNMSSLRASPGGSDRRGLLCCTALHGPQDPGRWPFHSGVSCSAERVEKSSSGGEHTA